MYICMYVCMYIYMYIYMYVCMSIYIYMYRVHVGFRWFLGLYKRCDWDCTNDVLQWKRVTISFLHSFVSVIVNLLDWLLL